MKVAGQHGPAHWERDWLISLHLPPPLDSWAEVRWLPLALLDGLVLGVCHLATPTEASPSKLIEELVLALRFGGLL